MATLELLAGRHPILSSETMSYADSCGYSATRDRRNEGDPVLVVRHTVTGERCLVRELLLSGHARAVSTVVAPWAMFRKTFLADERSGPSSTGDAIRVVQKIPLRTEEFEPSIKMQPAIVILDPPPPIVLGEEHGVDEVWHGEEVVFQKGAILTDHIWWETQLGKSILKVVKARNKKLLQGSYEVSLVAEHGFYFQMKVSPDLFDSLHYPGSAAARAHVQSLYAMAFSEGLVQLRKSYGDPDEWKNYSNLVSLRSYLKQRNLRAWDEGSDDEFQPNQIVAALYPHQIFNPDESESGQGELGF